MDVRKIGELVYWHRDDRGWTQEKLAEESGISATTISNIETGSIARVRMNTIRRIARALNMTTDEFLRGEMPALTKKAEAPPDSDTGEAGLAQGLTGMPHSRISEFRRGPSEPAIAAAIEAVLARSGVDTQWGSLSDEEWSQRLEEASTEEAARSLYFSVEDERVATRNARWGLFVGGTPEEKRAQARMLQRYWIRGLEAARKTRSPQAVESAEAAAERELEMFSGVS